MDINKKGEVEVCANHGVTVLLGSPLIYCSLRRKEYPKKCKSCPKYEAKIIKLGTKWQPLRNW